MKKKIIAIITVITIISLTLSACSGSNKTTSDNAASDSDSSPSTYSSSSNASDKQLELINYIVENGTYSEEQDWYYINKSFHEDDGLYSTSIGYEVETSELLFIDMCVDSNGGLVLTYLDYAFDAREQEVLVDIEFNGETITVTGTIKPDTYSLTNTQIHSYEATHDENSVRYVSEFAVLQLVKHAQLMMEELEVSLESFGFENFESN